MASSLSPAPEMPRQRAQALKVKGFLGLLYVGICTLGVLYAPQPLLNVLRAEFGTSEATTGLMLTVTLVPLCIAPLAYGAVLARVSARRLLFGAVSLLGVSGIWLALAPNFPMLLAGRFVQGLIIPAVFTSVMTLIGGKFQGADLQRAMAMYIGSTILGGFLGRLGAGLISSFWGWRVALLIISAAMLPALYALRHVSRDQKTGAARHRLREYIAVFRTPSMGWLLCIEGLGMVCLVGVTNLLPFRMAEIGGGDSEFRVGLMYSTYLVGVVISLSSRRVIRWCGSETRAIIVGLCIFAASLPGMIVPSDLMLFCMLFLLTIGQFTEHSLAPGLVNRLAMHDKGLVNGLYLSIYYLGGVIGSYVPGLIYNTWSWEVCMGVLLTLQLLSLSFAVHLHRTIKL